MTDDRDRAANEILDAAIAAKRQTEAADATDTKRRNWPLAAVGLGVGSAALAGALIYAGRGRKK